MREWCGCKCPHNAGCWNCCMYFLKPGPSIFVYLHSNTPSSNKQSLFILCLPELYGLTICVSKNIDHSTWYIGSKSRLFTLHCIFFKKIAAIIVLVFRWGYFTQTLNYSQPMVKDYVPPWKHSSCALVNPIFVFSTAAVYRSLLLTHSLPNPGPNPNSNYYSNPNRHQYSDPHHGFSS